MCIRDSDKAAVAVEERARFRSERKRAPLVSSCFAAPPALLRLLLCGKEPCRGAGSIPLRAQTCASRVLLFLLRLLPCCASCFAAKSMLTATRSRTCCASTPSRVSSKLCACRSRRIQGRAAQAHRAGYHPSTHAVASLSRVHHARCLLYTSPSPRDRTRSRMPSSA